MAARSLVGSRLSFGQVVNGLKAWRGEPRRAASRLSRFRVPKFTHGRCNKALCAPFYRIPCPGFRISSDAMPAGYVALNRCQPPFCDSSNAPRCDRAVEERSWAFLRRQRFSHPGIRASPPLNSLLFFFFSLSFFFLFRRVVQQIEHKVRGHAITVEPPWSRIQHVDIWSVI